MNIRFTTTKERGPDWVWRNRIAAVHTVVKSQDWMVVHLSSTAVVSTAVVSTCLSLHNHLLFKSS